MHERTTQDKTHSPSQSRRQGHPERSRRKQLQKLAKLIK